MGKAILRRRTRVEQGQGVVETEPVGRNLYPSACDIEDQLKDLPADIGDGHLACSDAAGVDVDQIVPAFAERRVGRNL